MSRRSSFASTSQSWQNQNWPIRIIRLWLGITWIYGGWVKASDHGFLTKGAPSYIGTQLAGFVHVSPIGFLLQHGVEHAQLFGVIVMLSEFAIGFATLIGIAPTAAAFGGLSMSIVLWLSSSWTVKPYFLGSDTAYAILWLSLLLTLIGKRRRIDLSLDRRGAVRIGGVALLSLIGIGFGKALEKSTTSTSSTSSSAATPGIIKLADLPVGATFEFNSPLAGPAMLFRTAKGVFAYSLTCTHQGCVVGYAKSAKQLQCPCHGAIFDPFNGAQVLAGPAPTPLAPIKVKTSGAWVVEA
jgi:nitrite reductase/ring-hydroxylating ferredoxin subunit/uncharacterized membrane protein YphA (DoxX/SURF4 family)